MKKAAAQTPATDPDPASALGYGQPDAQGYRYRTEPVGALVRVHVLTPTGEALNVLAADEAEGKTTLAAHLGQKEE